MARRALTLLLLALVACGSGGSQPGSGDAAPPPSDGGYPPPRQDLVPGVGGSGSLDIAAWNIENFPLLPSTPRLMADLITSLDLDLVAVEEIADIDAFHELIARLPDYKGLLSEDTYGDGTYQKVGFIYRSSLLSLKDGVLLFEGDSYAFPRPPLQVIVTADDGSHPPVDFVAIAVHLKAGFDGADRDRRTAAVTALQDHISQVVTSGLDGDVIVLGDFNEVLSSSAGEAVFAPFLDRPDSYTVHTQKLADNGATSYLPSGSLIDHAISTADLDDEFSGGRDLIPSLDRQLDSYQTAVSDHLPIVVTMPIF